MVRSFSRVLFTIGCLAGCGSNTSSGGDAAGATKGALDIVPGDDTVSDWKIDRPSNKNADGSPMTGTSKSAVENWIDGAASPFFIDPYTPTLFAWQNYVNSKLAAAQPDGAFISMYVLQMPTAEQASGLYSVVLQTSEYDRKKGTPDDWKSTSPVIGTESRIEDTGSKWWINFRKGVFYVEVKMDPSTGPEPDFLPGNAETKAETIRFAKAVADRI